MKTIKSLFLVMAFLLPTESLLAGREEDEAAEQTFTKAHPWYGEIRKVREEERVPFHWFHMDPPVGPVFPVYADIPPMPPHEGMRFAADRYLNSSRFEDEKQQALAWLQKGVKANIPMAKAVAVLLAHESLNESSQQRYDRFSLIKDLNLSPQDKISIAPNLLKFVKGSLVYYDSLLLRGILTYLTKCDLPPDTKRLVLDVYGRTLMCSYGDHEVSHGYESARFSLLDSLHRYDPEATVTNMKSFLDDYLKDKQLERCGVKFLFKLKAWSEPSFVEQVATLKKKYTREQLQRLFNQYGDHWHRYRVP